MWGENKRMLAEVREQRIWGRAEVLTHQVELSHQELTHHSDVRETVVRVNRNNFKHVHAMEIGRASCRERV